MTKNGAVLPCLPSGSETEPRRRSLKRIGPNAQYNSSDLDGAPRFVGSDALASGFPRQYRPRNWVPLPPRRVVSLAAIRVWADRHRCRPAEGGNGGDGTHRCQRWVVQSEAVREPVSSPAFIAYRAAPELNTPSTPDGLCTARLDPFADSERPPM